MTEQNRVQWVYAAKNNDDLATRYDEWAKDYDSDLERDFGWNGHVLGVDLLVKYVTSNASVIDVGVGTGLAGAELQKRGFSLMDGFDLSKGMLAEARKRGIYKDLRVGVLGEPLDYPTATYDAAIATGVFSIGHAPASGWDEVARIVRPNGYFVITLRPDIFEQYGFKSERGRARGCWQVEARGGDRCPGAAAQGRAGHRTPVPRVPGTHLGHRSPVPVLIQRNYPATIIELPNVATGCATRRLTGEPYWLISARVLPEADCLRKAVRFGRTSRNIPIRGQL